MTVLFFRGFNTYSDDDLRFGPVNFGPAHQHLESHFVKSGIRFIALPDVGRGAIHLQVERCIKNFEHLAQQNQIKGPIHFLGHSAGGLIARALAHHIHSVASVTTIASPNRGSYLAQFLVELSHKSHPIQRIKYFGYNIDSRIAHYQHWTPQNIEVFNQQYPDKPNVHYASVAAACPHDLQPIVLKFISQKIMRDVGPTDGILELSTQPWGHVIGHYQLDHGAQLGFVTHFSAYKNTVKRNEFNTMATKIISHLKAVNAKIHQ